MSGLSRIYRLNESAGVEGVLLDIELLIRILEWAREEARSDVEIHRVAESLDAMSDGSTMLTMDDYERIMGSAVVGDEGGGGGGDEGISD